MKDFDLSMLKKMTCGVRERMTGYALLKDIKEAVHKLLDVQDVSKLPTSW